MRHYEIMIILDPNLEERTVQPSLEGFLTVVTTDGGKVGKLDIWGKRRLSYPIDKKPEGIYAIVDLNLVHGALLALFGLVAALPQPPADDDPHAALQALGDVLGHLPPDVAGEEEAVAVLPIAGRGVAQPRRRGDPEGRNRLTGWGESEFRVGDEVADDRDGGVSCRHSGAPGLSRTDG